MAKKSRYLRMEESRNRRLWFTSVIMPTLTTGATLYATVPKFRDFVDNKYLDIKEAINLKKAELKTKAEERKAKREAK